jgi:hypothetical protein
MLNELDVNGLAESLSDDFHTVFVECSHLVLQHLISKRSKIITDIPDAQVDKSGSVRHLQSKRHLNVLNIIRDCLMWFFSFLN